MNAKNKPKRRSLKVREVKNRNWSNNKKPRLPIIVKEWKDVISYKILVAKAEIYLSWSKLVALRDPRDNHPPDIVVVINTNDRKCLIAGTGRETEDILLLVRRLENELNKLDSTARYGGAKWRLDEGRLSLTSPKEIPTSLQWQEIIGAIETELTLIVAKQVRTKINQNLQEARRLSSIPILPRPGEVDETLKLQMLQKFDIPPGFSIRATKIRVTKKGIALTL